MPVIIIPPALRAADPSYASLIDAFNGMQEVVELQRQTIANLQKTAECWENVAAAREADNVTLRARLTAALQQRAA